VYFKSVITALFQDYNPATGQFTCPLDGVYMFHVTVTPLGGQPATHIHVEIVKESGAFGRAFAHLHSNSASGSVSVFTECRKGKMVWVINHPNYTGNAAQAGWSFFSGAFLRPLRQ
jgi:hypothetical protein